ncbi:MAG: VOC family protein [Chloroflexi bacterium]|nr:VOC family protein [Chloroflexota bacterium]
MPQYTNLSQGTPFWVDLSSPDIEASMSFYANLFGWGYDEAPPEDVGGRRYAWAKIASGYSAGIASLDDEAIASGAKPQWSVQLLVDDMDEIVSRIADFGGSVIEAPSKVGEYGLGAQIADPTGGRVNIWQAFQSGPTIKHEHGSMQWCELMTPDPETAAAFYRTLLRVKTDPMEMPDGSSNYIVHTQDGPVISISALAGLSEELLARLGGPTWIVYFNVDDVDAAVERAVQNGAELPDPPWDVPGVGRIAWIFDPLGALLGLITPPSS